MRRLATLLLLVGTVALEGCSHQCRRPFTPTCPKPCAPCPPPCPPACPPPGMPAPPALMAPMPPPPAAPAPPPAPPMPPPPAQPMPPAPPSGDLRYYAPPQQRQSWRPADPGTSPPPIARLETPRSETPRYEPPRSEVPRPDPPSEPKLLPPTTEEKRMPQGEPEGRSMTPSLPVGIQQFAAVRDGVTSGLRPDLDGIEWLKINNYRAVLHVKAPGTDDSADRKLFERHGLRYLSIDAAAQSLNREVLDEFNRVTSDKADQPLFVYDKDGSVAGALWYLQFRFMERMSDDDARVKSDRLGLKDDHRDLWLSIHKLIADHLR